MKGMPRAGIVASMLDASTSMRQPFCLEAEDLRTWSRLGRGRGMKDLEKDLDEANRLEWCTEWSLRASSRRVTATRGFGSYSRQCIDKMHPMGGLFTATLKIEKIYDRLSYFIFSHTPSSWKTQNGL